MTRARGRPRTKREIRITPVRREEIDVRRLARALIALAQAEAQAEALAPKEKRDETN